MSQPTTKSPIRLAAATGHVGGELAALLITALQSLLLFIALVLIQRRYEGALTASLDGSLLVAASGAVVWLALAIRLAQRRWLCGSAHYQRASWLAPTLAVLITGGALSLPGASVATYVGIWSLIILEESWACGAGRWTARQVGPVIIKFIGAKQPSLNAPAVTPLALVTAHDVNDLEATESNHAEEAVGEDVTQRLIRTDSNKEGDVLRGQVRATLVAEQRTCHVHVAFCPPFPGVPEIEFQQTEGPPARIKPGQVLPWGLRFDVKLNSVGPARVGIEFTATANSSK